MRAITALTLTLLLATLATSTFAGDVVTITIDDVRNLKGDGPDGKGNTNDDTWQFWFELVRPHGKFLHLDLPTETLSASQRAKGIPGKVSGPIAKDLPNPDQTQGWIYHSDWDGCFEGVWGDAKTKKVMIHPYVEKRAHRAVALSYTVPKAGAYKITGAVTDGYIWKHKRHQGFKAVVCAGKLEGKFMVCTKELTRSGIIGDKVGPDSGTFKVDSVELAKNDLIVLYVHPNGWWGTDLMVIDDLKIEYLGAAAPKAAPPAKDTSAPAKPAGGALVLTPDIAADPNGDGPDGKGNTGDDTWQYWLMILHDRNLYIRMPLATKLLSEEIRKNGIRRKVWGPIGSTLPNPKDTEGWIYKSDWDGKREGVWGDKKAKQVLVVPYQEKMDGAPLAVTCKIPADGTYVVAGKATDLEVDTKHKFADGARVSVELTKAMDGSKVRRTRGKVLVKPTAFGDKGPKSVTFKSEPVALKKGQLVFLMIDPIRIAYKDTTAVELTVTPVK